MKLDKIFEWNPEKSAKLLSERGLSFEMIVAAIDADNMIDFYSTFKHDYDSYELSHKGRLDFLVEDLKLNELKGKIADFGCGLGFIYNRLNKELQKNYIGYDYTDLKNPPFQYYKVDLNNFEADKKNVLVKTLNQTKWINR